MNNLRVRSAVGSLLLSSVAMCCFPVTSSGVELIDQWFLGTDGFSSIRDISIDTESRLYVSHASGIAKYDSEGTLLTQWTTGRGAKSAVGPHGNVYVLDLHADKVLKYDSEGTLITEWLAYFPWEVSTGASPSGIAVDSNDNVYICDSKSGRVAKFDSGGEYITLWSTATSSGKSSPSDITVDDEDNLFVFDQGRVKKYSVGGDLLASWLNSLPTGEIGYGGDISVDSWGNVYVTDAYEPRILVWGNSGHPLGSFSASTDSWEPQSTAIDRSGNIYVAEGLEDRVQKYRPFGPAFEALEDPAVLLHVMPVDDGQNGACAGAPQSPDEVVIEGRGVGGKGGSYFVYLLASPAVYMGGDLSGITGLQVGVQFEGVGGSGKGIEIHDWTVCAELEFAQDAWPESGSGNTITWSVDQCQESALVPAGVFYLSAYVPSTMSITGYPVTGVAKVANCLIVELEANAGLSPIRLGRAGFEDALGCNPLLEPCSDVTPTMGITWGRIKAKYGN